VPTSSLICAWPFLCALSDGGGRHRRAGARLFTPRRLASSPARRYDTHARQREAAERACHGEGPATERIGTAATLATARLRITRNTTRSITDPDSAGCRLFVTGARSLSPSPPILRSGR